ncbi:mitochondrial import receptor subunit TOM7 homolog [Sander lucioperca]|uniref:Mitochondrial import receptor subunit TOM7 homolog n=1 Tax=Sander lucioperca TaxID=283035 RepID=A0A8C9ZTJ6_SANLU|nr:mitochondrial import receptor subunit TOM7 homolog [Sander lucioperca]
MSVNSMYIRKQPGAHVTSSFLSLVGCNIVAVREKHMAKLSKETKQRLQQLFQCGQFVIRWGFIPTVLYLGFKRGADPGMPEPTVLSLLWG